ncbi:amino acid adenylation domain-containing protein [Chitinophaga sp. G-6-1-13]|uniref:Amino acid adenylation domain-containing protein n=1 Tax=Chitinophaga fulva TaxID=2728842 RepID=A0A848GME5_9BACT|nr:non-ribosomal peptide synthetase [Chitinophaga fulva]NML37850.1 amino acid adenylation domain-containing protein [Chitinophaga fulva]
MKRNRIVPRLAHDGLQLHGDLSVLSPDLLQQIEEQKAALTAFLAEGQDAHRSAAIAPVALQPDYPVTGAQQGIWMLCRQEQSNAAYNIVTPLHLRGRWEHGRLQEAFRFLADRHESLRTRFREVNGNIRQYVSDAGKLLLHYRDLREENNKSQLLASLVREAIRQPFDLANGPLLSATLVQLETEDWVLVLAVHHIVSDGSSVMLMVKDMMHYYEHGQHRTASLGIHYKDYTKWLEVLLSGQYGKRALKFWTGYLQSPPAPLNIPADYQRPAGRSFAGAVMRFDLDETLYPAIAAHCKDTGVTAFNFLRAALCLLLNKITGQTDVVMGTPVSGRGHFDLQNQVGLYVNTLPLRTIVDGNISWRDFLKKSAGDTLQVFEHQHYPFERMLDELDIRWEASHNPLFDVMLVLQDTANGAAHTYNQQDTSLSCQVLDMGSTEMMQVIGDNVFSKFDLSFNFSHLPGNHFCLEIEYATALFAKETISRYYQFWQYIVEQVLAAPERTIKDITIVTPAERKLILEAFNNTDRYFDKTNTITGLITAQSIKTPEAPALVYGPHVLCYREMNETVNQLAHHLMAHCRLNAGDRVAISLPRSGWMVMSILAVLKTGAAYVPLDAAYPEDRIRFIVEDSQCKTVINEEMLTAFRATQHLYTKEEPSASPESDAVAYVIYTSGSTGRPKGVMITHRSANAFISWCVDEFRQDVFDKVLAVTSICFDISVLEMFFTLSAGKTLVVLPGHEAVPAALQEEGNYLLSTVPSVADALLEGNADLSRLRTLVLGGETLPDHLPGRLPEAVVLRNLYGPTETTVYSTAYRMKKDGLILIGRPISNTRVYILDKQGALLPAGITGEIFIAGEGVGKGYLNRSELTAARFLPDPFSDGRMYRSGDLGKWLPDGNIVFIGRDDTQLKINGFRIELGEIEHVLAGYPGVKLPVVLPVTGAGGQKVLVACFTGEQEIAAAKLSAFLQSQLPSYMVPVDFIYMKVFPLTPNGKIDKKALLQSMPAVTVNRQLVAPRTAAEQQVAALWKELLRLETVSVTDNFFHVGGNSLKAISLANLLHRELGVSVSLSDLFNYSTVAELAWWVTEGSNNLRQPIPPAAVLPDYPLSAAQQQLWIIGQQPEASVAYNMPGVFRLEGELITAALEHAFRCVIERHETLRTSFTEDGLGDIRQKIHAADSLHFELLCHDLRNTPEKDATLRSLLTTAFDTPFELDKPVLPAVTLYQLEDNSWILLCVLHHIVADGWSVNVLFRDVAHYYAHYLDDLIAPLPPLPVQCKDIVTWEQQELSAGTNASAQYWLQQFEGELPVTDLAYKTRPTVKSHQGEIVEVPISASLIAELEGLAQKNKATLFMCMLAVLNSLLHRYNGQEDIVIGTPQAGRTHAELKDQIGFYINMLALRTKFSGGDSFQGLLSYVRDVVTGAFRHQEYPYHELVRALRVPTDPSRNPLFDIVLTMQEEDPATTQTGRFPGLRLEPFAAVPFTAAKFDLLFDIVARQGAYSLCITYNTDLFDREAIGRMAHHFVGIAEAAVQQPGLPLQQLDYIGDAEKTMLLGFNDQQAPFPGHSTVVQLIEEQVSRTPENIAVVCNDRFFTYARLNEEANRIAACLRADKSVCPNTFVGVKLPKDEWLIAVILGILKSGAAYLPLDTAYPADRIQYMTDNSGCSLVIDETWLKTFQEARDTYTATNPEAVHVPADLIYLIYTSGSTGGPKGAMVSHYSFTNLVCWYAHILDLQADDTVLLMAPVSFDLAQKNIFAPLVSGSRLCVPDTFASDYYQLADTIASKQVTVVNAAPSAFYPLLDNLVNDNFQKLASLRKVVLGGEPVLMEHLQPLITSALFRGSIINSYGPTECTDVASWLERDVTACLAADHFPIGIPVSNCRLYVLDKQYQLVPAGCTGEIFIAGTGVGKGYLHQSALTAEKFLPDPFHPDELMYRTGDLGRWLPGALLDFIGRKDEQIKIRGYRIEPGEIETALKQCQEVEAAVVVARQAADGMKEIAAFVTGKCLLNFSEIKKQLAGILASHMLPARFIQLEQIPLTPSGKADRKTLSTWKDAGAASDTAQVPLQSPMETALAEIWSELLDRPVTDAASNFFALGGNSLRVVRLSTYIRRRFNVSIPVRELFEHPVLAAQARLVSQGSQPSLDVIPVAAPQSGYLLLPSQERLWALSQLNGGSLAYHITGIYNLEGPLQVNALENAFSAVIARHESLRTVFREDEQLNIRQFILEEIPLFRIPVIVIPADEQRPEQLNRLLEAAHNHPFNLKEGPLLRAMLLRLSDTAWILVYSMHHIICDGWSAQVLTAEISRHYNACVGGESSPFTPLPFQYKDYVAWQLEPARQHAMEADREYWSQQFAGTPPVLNLPGDRQRPAIQTFTGAQVSKHIRPSTVQLMHQLNRHVNGSTLFTLLLSAVYALLYRYTEQEDIIIGTPIAGRDHADLEGQVGLYINTLALRMRGAATNDFHTLLADTRQNCLDAFSHQQLPFEELATLLPHKRDISRNLLFDVMVIVEDRDSVVEEQLQLNDITVAAYPETPTRSSKVDLTFIFSEKADGIRFVIEYNNDIYNEDTVVRLANNFEVLLNALMENPVTPVKQLPFITTQERHQLLSGFNDTTVSFPQEATVLRRFREMAGTSPEQAAVLCGEQQLSYGALNTASDRLAVYLDKVYGIKPGDRVGLKLARNKEMVVALLGILKSGATYVPLDPAYPQQRIDYIEADSSCALVLDEAVLRQFNAWPEHVMDVPLHNPQPEDAAYIIYTSGSTGAPKGVVVGHHSLNAFINWCHLEFDQEDAAIVYAATSICFDLSVFEIFYTLTAGKTIRLLGSPLSIPDFLKQDRKVLLNTVPGVMGSLLQENVDLSAVNVVNMAGEALPYSYAAALLSKGIVVRNLYGPSEDTTYSTCFRMKPGDDVRIGAPIANTQAYILDEALKIRPIGTIGEICLAGDGLAQGYLNQPVLTAEKFVAHPFRQGERLYRTGDLGRWTADGQIIFAGRKDAQVKLHGYRIEPGEIEQVLEQHAGIRQAVVLLITGNGDDPYLAAYIQSEEEIPGRELKSWIGARIPEYMVPARFIHMKTFPVGTTGKTDRSRLPVPASDKHAGGDYVAPATETEKQLQLLWQDLLRKDNISIRDNFFEIGGHSLKAAQLIMRINNIYQVNIDLRYFLLEATIEELAGKITFILEQRKQLTKGGNLVQIDI